MFPKLCQSIPIFSYYTYSKQIIGVILATMYNHVYIVALPSVQERALRVSVMRDHTHGSNRDWKLMHRYCLHNFTCQDGTRGFLGVVSQPGTFSYLELGYIYDKKGQKQPVQVEMSCASLQ